MNVTKTIKATAVRGRTSTASPIIKEDYGLYLLIGGIDLPEVYEVDFSNDEHAGTSVTMVGNADGVLIPNQFIKSGKDVFAFYYHVGENFGRTLYTIRIPNKLRPDRTNETPTPEEQSVIDQAISALNTAVAKTAQDVISADQSARSASGDADRAERAKTGAETAQGKAEEAQESAERAKDDAETSERNASESERNAKGYAEAASEKADSIHSMTASAQTLPAGSSASASYNAETGVMTFGIPKGKDGRDGTDGTDGTDGIDGISPSVSVTDITGGHRVVITDKDGAKSFDVEDGETGATPNLTIGTVETLDPTDDATATITGTPENPVLNLGIPRGESGETIDTAPIITDTASGAIASFTDGADDLPLKSLIVDINPIQDLHGQDSPYPAGGGKNLFNWSRTEGTPNPTTASPSTSPRVMDTEHYFAGITRNNYYGINNQVSAYSVANGIISVTTTSGGYGLGFPVEIEENTGYAVSYVNVNNGKVSIGYYDKDWNYIVDRDAYSAPYTTTAPAGAKYAVFVVTPVNIVAGQNNECTVKDIQVELGTTATSYAPYENICPISGRSGVNVSRTGKNLLNSFAVFDNEQYYSINNDGSIQVLKSDGRSWDTVTAIPIKAGTYVLSRNSSNGWGDIRLSTENYEVPHYLHGSIGNLSVTFTLESDGYYKIKAGYSASEYPFTIKYQLELGSTATPYEPYTGRSITINLGQTVYGGHLDVVSGVLTVDRTISMLDNANLLYQDGDIISYRLDFADRKLFSNSITGLICSAFIASTDVSPAIRWRGAAQFRLSFLGTSIETLTALINNGQLVVSYPIATPIEIQLSANQLNSLLGVNNIWADSGDTEVEYRADTKLFIERLTAPDSADMIADANITSGQYFMVGNTLYKATANIANGSAIIVGTNAVRKSLSEALNEINA